MRIMQSAYLTMAYTRRATRHDRTAHESRAPDPRHAMRATPCACLPIPHCSQELPPALRHVTRTRAMDPTHAYVGAKRRAHLLRLVVQPGERCCRRVDSTRCGSPGVSAARVSTGAGLLRHGVARNAPRGGDVALAHPAEPSLAGAAAGALRAAQGCSPAARVPPAHHPPGPGPGPPG